MLIYAYDAQDATRHTQALLKRLPQALRNMPEDMRRAGFEALSLKEAIASGYLLWNHGLESNTHDFIVPKLMASKLPPNFAELLNPPARNTPSVQAEKKKIYGQISNVKMNREARLAMLDDDRWICQYVDEHGNDEEYVETHKIVYLALRTLAALEHCIAAGCCPLKEMPTTPEVVWVIAQLNNPPFERCEPTANSSDEKYVRTHM